MKYHSMPLKLQDKEATNVSNPKNIALDAWKSKKILLSTLHAR
jgi:hypothetical protein